MVWVKKGENMWNISKEFIFLSSKYSSNYFRKKYDRNKQILPGQRWGQKDLIQPNTRDLNRLTMLKKEGHHPPPFWHPPCPTVEVTPFPVYTHVNCFRIIMIRLDTQPGPNPSRPVILQTFIQGCHGFTMGSTIIY